jgi:cytoskeletal protein CcmA (bactofilin family)
MFGFKRRNEKHISSLIGAGSTLVGDLTFADGLRIDGTVHGSVRCVGGEGAGMLVVSEKGVIEGEVRAAHLVVAGRITGPVFTTEMVELQPKARIVGDVHYRAIEIHHGAVVDGRLVHEAAASEPARGNLKLAVAVAAGGPKTKSPSG